MKIYPQAIRDHAVAAVERGLPRSQVAGTFGLSLPTLDRWLHQKRTLGHVTLPARGHTPRRLSAADLAQLKAQLQQWPDATLEQHLWHWQTHGGTPVSQTTLWRALRSFGWTRKKRVCAPANVIPSPAPPGRRR